MDNILDAVRITCKALDEHLANDIKVIDIGHLKTISEYFVIADAKNENQMKALQDAVEDIERIWSDGKMLDVDMLIN